jgi:hypothetical protein
MQSHARRSAKSHNPLRVLQQGSALTIGLFFYTLFNIFNAAVMDILNAKSFEALLQLAPKNGVAGGRTYDAVIGTCAEQGKASTVLTFNASDFAGLGKDFKPELQSASRGR